MREAAELVKPARSPTFVVAGAQDKNVPLHLLSGLMGWANRTLVLGGAGHEIQAVLKDEDCDEIISWLRALVM